jgi:hypothetical protein
LKKHCLDSNVFIEAKNGPYSFDIAPAFWSVLDEELRAGRIFSVRNVYEELMKQSDNLKLWAQSRKQYGLAVPPNAETQRRYREIVSYVYARFPQQHADFFLSGADPWVIAQAWVDACIVVTQESRAPANTQKPKVPNVSRHFGVPYINTYGMLRELGRSLDGFK